MTSCVRGHRRGRSEPRLPPGRRGSKWSLTHLFLARTSHVRPQARFHVFLPATFKIDAITVIILSILQVRKLRLKEATQLTDSSPGVSNFQVLMLNLELCGPRCGLQTEAHPAAGLRPRAVTASWGRAAVLSGHQSLLCFPGQGTLASEPHR